MALHRVCLDLKCSNHELLCDQCEVSNHASHDTKEVSELPDLIQSYQRNKEVNLKAKEQLQKCKKARVTAQSAVLDAKHLIDECFDSAIKRIQELHDEFESELEAECKLYFSLVPSNFSLDTYRQLQTINAQVVEAAEGVIKCREFRKEYIGNVGNVYEQASSTMKRFREIVTDVLQYSQRHLNRILRQKDPEQAKLAVSQLYELTRRHWFEQVDSNVLNRKLREHTWSIKAEARRSNQKAMFLLGRMHDLSIGVPQSKILAKHWLEMAAKRDEPFSWGSLIFTEKSNEKIVAYLREGVRLNDFRCLAALGDAYAHGFYNLQPNRQKAVDLLKRSCELGFPLAFYNLGCLAQEPNEAEKHLLKAVQLEYKSAVLPLADCFYTKGRFTPALEHYRKAVEFEGNSTERNLIRHKIVECCHRLGRIEQAKSWLDSAETSRQV